MSKKKENLPTLPSKKDFRKKVAATLQSTFTDIKEQLGEKKFTARVKKAARLLAQGLVAEGATASNKKTKNKKETKLVAASTEPAIAAIV